MKGFLLPDVSTDTLSRQIIDVEFESIISREFKYIGVNKSYITILNELNKPTYSYSYLFNQPEINIYFKHVKHDVYLKEYLRRKLFGKICYLQDLVNNKNIKCDIFNHVLRDAIGLDHSTCGIYPLPYRHKLILSTHTDMRPRDNSWKHYNHLWHFIQDWAKTRVYHEVMTHSRKQLLINECKINNLLTNAETAVLMLLLQGLDGSEIAKLRSVSKETVKSQLKRILHKTGCRHQNQLFAKYYQGELDNHL